LFIPGFNLYWIFIALSSFPTALKRYCDQNGYKQVKIPNKYLSIVANIFWIVLSIPIDDLSVLTFVGIVLYLIFFYQCAKSVAALECARELGHQQEAETLSKELETIIDEEEKLSNELRGLKRPLFLLLITL
ncbi:MAG: hypothetical protein NTX05_02085, partial [Fusobacteria bacterium]|nr:hypothetical protein [Fusobacteriota bacterium]